MTKRDKIEKIRKAYNGNWISKKQLSDIGFSSAQIWDLENTGIIKGVVVTKDGAFIDGAVGNPTPLDGFKNPDKSTVNVDFTKGNKTFKSVIYYTLNKGL
jgi:hypothetical protein